MRLPGFKSLLASALSPRPFHTLPNVSTIPWSHLQNSVENGPYFTRLLGVNERTRLHLVQSQVCWGAQKTGGDLKVSVSEASDWPDSLTSSFLALICKDRERDFLVGICKWIEMRFCLGETKRIIGKESKVFSKFSVDFLILPYWRRRKTKKVAA